MLNFIAKFLLKRKQKKLQRKIKVFNLSSAKSALILYSQGSNEKEVREFARFLKEEGIKTTTLGFFKKKSKKDLIPPNELNYHYYDKKSLNWLGFPNRPEIKKLIDEPFHLLIDLNLEANFSLQAISTLSKASFKIGSAMDYQKESCDLNIATKEESLSFLIEQLKKYLKIINS